MSKHALRRPRYALRRPERHRPRIVSTLSVLVVVMATTLSMMLTGSAKNNSDPIATVAFGSGTHMVACAGREIGVTRGGASDVKVVCEYGVRRVGAAQTFVAAEARTARTALPAGTAAGTLLISSVQTSASSTVSMKGWTKAYDFVSATRGLRLATWWRVAVPDEAAPVATLSAPVRVSMMTLAFTGIDPQAPLRSTGTGAGLTAPAGRGVDGGMWLHSLGAQGPRVRVTPPDGATSVGTLANGYNMTAQAVSASESGATPPSTWSARRVRAAVAGLLGLGPAPKAAVPPGATAVAAGANMNVSCGSLALEYEVVSATVLSVTCEGEESSNPTPSATPTSSPTPTTTPTTTPTSPTHSPSPSASPTVTPPAGSAPTAPTNVCDTSALAGPASAPPGAIVVQPTQKLDDLVQSRSSGATYWLAPGVHTLVNGQYDQVRPNTGDTFIGAPGAILDGRHINLYAFGGTAANVTISNLTIQNFGSAGDNNNEGVVNHDSARNWTIARNTIQLNAGAGVMIGSDDRVLANCIRNNGQYAFNAYHSNGVTNIVLDGNEISGNNTDDWEKRQPGCGCTGGGKFWETRGAVVTNNYVHDNKGVGLWADSNNADFLFQGNYVSGNDDEGIMYETSYNAAILNNTFVRNALVKGPTNPGFPASAIYISEAGSDSRVAGSYGDRLRISGNVFTDNWAGVVAWENADRFAGSPANTSTGMTTLVNPDVATVEACSTPSLIATKPYFDDCRWKTQNLLVDHNIFTLNAANVQGCSVDDSCGLNGLFSNHGTYPSWSPYKGSVIRESITFHQNNVWQNNRYQGPWSFMVYDQATVLPLAKWQAAPFNQDAGSTLD